METKETIALPDGRGRSILSLGGRGAMDDAASAMLSQVLVVQGAQIRQADHVSIGGRDLKTLVADDIDTVVVTFLNGNSKSHARQIVRRLKRIRPSLRVGILMPMADGELYKTIDPEDISADFVAASLTQAVVSTLNDKGPVLLKSPVRKVTRQRRAQTAAA